MSRKFHVHASRQHTKPVLSWGIRLFRWAAVVFSTTVVLVVNENTQATEIQWVCAFISTPLTESSMS
ncbi:MAG: hypothetical protein U0003_02890 [Vampirovibrionales bacterium]